MVRRLLLSGEYADGSATISDSCRRGSDPPYDDSLELFWSGLGDDFRRYINTYQDPQTTEHAALGLACILVHQRLGQEVTEVTRRGEKVDYWLGDRELLLEVSGEQHCNVGELCERKASQQLLQNPFLKSGYVCAVDFGTRNARLWFYGYPNEQ